MVRAAFEFAALAVRIGRVKWPGWLPRVLVESALIVFSVLVALAVDEWRDQRATATRPREAVAAITAELQANRWRHSKDEDRTWLS